MFPEVILEYPLRLMSRTCTCFHIMRPQLICSFFVFCLFSGFWLLFITFLSSLVTICPTNLSQETQPPRTIELIIIYSNMNSILLTQNVWLPIQRLKDDPVRHQFLTLLTSDKPKICFDSITSKAASFRGTSCSVDLAHVSIGRFSLAFPIVFDDGVHWLLRIITPTYSMVSKSVDNSPTYCMSMVHS